MSARSECSEGCGCAEQHRLDFEESERLRLHIIRREARIRDMERTLVMLRLDFMAMDHVGGCQGRSGPCDCGVGASIAAIDAAIRRDR